MYIYTAEKFHQDIPSGNLVRVLTRIALRKTNQRNVTPRMRAEQAIIPIQATPSQPYTHCFTFS